MMEWTLQPSYHILFSCGTISGFFIKWKKKVDMRCLNTEPLSAPGCLYRTDFSCKHSRRGTSSSFAKQPSHTGGLSPVSHLSFKILITFFLFLCFHTDLQPPRNRQLSQFDFTENSRGSIKGLPRPGEIIGRSCLCRVDWCHTLAWVVWVLAQGRDWTNGANWS